MIALLWCLATASEPASQPEIDIPTRGRVASVYDGDTFTLDGGTKVRLKWVNTPELRPKQAYGIEARDAAHTWINGQMVDLILDAREPVDGYGRVVAGARLPNGDDLSVLLLERGLGHLFIIPPDGADITEHIAAQERAKAARVGVWTTDGFQGALHITSFHANGRGDDEKFVNGEYLRVCNISDAPVDLGNYTITSRSGLRMTLPSVVIPIGHTVKIHSGKGTHQTDPSKQLTAYLMQDRPVWDNESDRVQILTADGAVVDSATQGS